MTSYAPVGRRANQVVELESLPEFEIGDKVVALCDVRNDGTYPGRPMGDHLIKAGDIGYVSATGTYLQMYYIYSVDFFERRMIVGMRAKEIDLVDDTCNAPKSE